MTDREGDRSLKGNDQLPSEEEVNQFFALYEGTLVEDNLPQVLSDSDEYQSASASLQSSRHDLLSSIYPIHAEEILGPDPSLPDLEKVYSQTYLHGSTGEPEAIQREGFTFRRVSSAGSRRSNGQLRVGGHFVFMTTDHQYALDYARNDHAKIVKMKIDTAARVKTLNFRKLDVISLLRIVPMVKKIATELYGVNCTDVKLKYLADEAVNNYIARLGADVLLSGPEADKTNELMVANQSVIQMV